MTPKSDPYVTVHKRASEFLIADSDHGGYKGGYCFVCGARGWLDTEPGAVNGIRHTQGCPVGNALAPVVEPQSEPDPVPDTRLRCGRCYDVAPTLFSSKCRERPEDLAGQPIGQYHCPDCGAMVMAGIEHPKVCYRCADRKHPGFDMPPLLPVPDVSDTDLEIQIAVRRHLKDQMVGTLYPRILEDEISVLGARWDAVKTGVSGDSQS